MAGEWIKMRPTLSTSPKVNGIARALERDERATSALAPGSRGLMSELVSRNVMRDVTVASLLRIWGAANEHTSDGVFRNADLSDIDDIAGVPGFGDAMAAVGWAQYDAETDCVTLPNFSEYNTVGSNRQRSSAAERQRRYRENRKKQSREHNVTEDATRDVTRNDREEKRREEKKDSNGTSASAADAKRETPSRKATADRPKYPPEFEQAWAAYPPRDGGNPKRDAFKSWNARRKEGTTPSAMLIGTKRYAAHIEAHGKLNTPYVMQAARFFGPSECYAEPYSTDPPSDTAKPSERRASASDHVMTGFD